MSSPVKSSISDPPPKPRRHPSRPHLHSPPQETSNTLPNSPSISEPSSITSSLASPSRPSMRSRPPSAIYLGSGDPDTPHQPVSPVLGRLNTPTPSGFPIFNKVGLGSPRLDFRSEWASSSRSHPVEKGLEEENYDTSLDISIEEKDVVKPPRPPPRSPSRDLGDGKTLLQSLVDKVSGLPSPPGTDSDIGSNQPKRDSVPNIPSPRRAASLSPQPPDHKSPSPPINPSPIRNPSRHLSPSSRSSSSSSSLGLVTRTRSTDKDSSLIGSPLKGSPRELDVSSKRHSNGSKFGSRRGSENQTSPRRSVIIDKPESSTSRISSPEKLSGHRHSPSMPVLTSSPKELRPSGRGSMSVENGIEPDSPIDLDKRIQEAENQIQRTMRTPGPSLSPVKTLRESGVGSMSRSGSSNSNSPLPNRSTLRRSTLSRSRMEETPERGSGVVYPSNGDDEIDERDRSGGSSGSGKRKPLPVEFRQASPYTPSPRTTNSSAQSHSSHTRPTYHESPVDTSSPLPSRLTTSRFSRDFAATTSPLSSTRSRLSNLDGPVRSSSVVGQNDAHVHRQWSESISGLPRRGEIDEHELPSPRAFLRDTQKDRRRAESVMEISAAYRYQSRGASAESGLTAKIPRREVSISSKSLFPSDSISAVGTSRNTGRETPSDRKDPLDVLRRFEESRAEHNKRWDERSVSVLGDSNTYSSIRELRPSSRIEHTPNPRSSTSMSSVRDSYHGRVPQTAPIEYRYRNSLQGNQPESPSIGRSRVVPSTSNGPRHMRSATSLGGRVSVDVGIASSEHGQLLFEAFKSLETKLPALSSDVSPDFMRTLSGHTKSTEGVNKNLRTALQIVTQLLVNIDLENLEVVRDDLSRLSNLIREGSKASDQGVRDLTRIMLDLPKMITGTRPGATTTPARSSLRGEAVSRRTELSPESRYSSINGNGPVTDRAQWSVDSKAPRPSTSMGDFASPTSRFSRDSLRDRPLGLGTPSPGYFRARLNRISGTGNALNPDDLNHLSSIEQSPPNPVHEEPVSGLRNKPSTSTIRGGGSSISNSNPITTPTNAFFPTMSRASTTAISNITAGPDPEDKSPLPNRTRSYNSPGETTRQSLNRLSSSSFSNHSNQSIEEGSEPDSIAALERSLASAAKAREEGKGARDRKLGLVAGAVTGGERRVSVGERFMSHLRGGSGV